MAESLELHFILSFWAQNADLEQSLAGWVIRQFEQTPLISYEFFALPSLVSECNVKVRISDEDPRKIWKMISDVPLRLSLAYVATISPKQRI